MAMAGGRLTCRDVTELATEYFEAGLGTPASERFARHVDGCGGCQAYLRQLRVTLDVARTLADPEPEPGPAPRPALLAAFRAWSASRDAGRGGE
jgi:hypothetical protein